MQAFLMGSFGALAVMAVLAVGIVIGWKAHAKICQAKAEPLTDVEKLKKKEMDEALIQLQNYNADVAYNRGGDRK